MLNRLHRTTRVLLLLGAFLLAASCSHSKKPAAASLTIPADSLTIGQACRTSATCMPGPSGAPDTAMLGRFSDAIDSAAAVLRSAAGGNPAALRDSILALVYGSWKIGFDPVDTSTPTLLPHCVFREKKGACLGIALVILTLAEKTGCPIYGVMLPHHFFCRYDDGKNRVNIEPNRSGFCHDDAYYRDRYDIKNMPWYTLGNLSPRQTIGVLCYDVGTICLHRKEYRPAIAFFREALHRIPSYGEAMGNMAVAYAQKGSIDTALTVFGELWASCPAMPNLAQNYGLVAASADRPRTALQVYCAAIERDPSNRVLFRRALPLVDRLGTDDSSNEVRRRFEALRSRLDTDRGGR